MYSFWTINWHPKIMFKYQPPQSNHYHYPRLIKTPPVRLEDSVGLCKSFQISFLVITFEQL